MQCGLVTALMEQMATMNIARHAEVRWIAHDRSATAVF